MLAKSKIKKFEYINNRNLIKKSCASNTKLLQNKKKSSAQLDKVFGKKNKRMLMLILIGHCSLDFKLVQWFSTFLELWAILYFLKVLDGRSLCGPPLLDQSSVAFHLQKQGLNFRVSVVCPVIALISKTNRSSPLGERFLPRPQKKSKKTIIIIKSSPKGRPIFALISETKGQRIGVPDFCQFSNRYNCNKNFLNQAPNFSNSSVAHPIMAPLVEKPCASYCCGPPNLPRTPVSNNDSLVCIYCLPLKYVMYRQPVAFCAFKILTSVFSQLEDHFVKAWC